MNPAILGLQGQGFLIRFLHEAVMHSGAHELDQNVGSFQVRARATDGMTC